MSSMNSESSKKDKKSPETTKRRWDSDCEANYQKFVKMILTTLLLPFLFFFSPLLLKGLLGSFASSASTVSLSSSLRLTLSMALTQLRLEKEEKPLKIT